MRDETPWRERQRSAIRTATDKIADVERKLRNGDVSMHQALLMAFGIGIEEGRANPAIVRIGENHSPEVTT